MPLAATAQLDSILMSLIQMKDAQKIDSILKSSPVDLQATDEDGANVLMWACYYADSITVATLFDHGAQAPNKGGGIYYKAFNKMRSQANGWYGSLLAVAVGESKYDVINYLIKVQKLDVNKQSPHLTNDTFSLWTPLMHAAHFDDYQMLRFLEEKGAKSDIKNKINLTASNLAGDYLLKEYLASNNLEALEAYTELYELEQENNKLYNDSKYKESLEVLEKRLSKTIQLYGEESKRVEMVLADKATMLSILEKQNEALEIYLKIYDGIEVRWGAYHNFHGSVLKEMGIIYQKLQQFDLSTSMFEKAKIIFGRSLGSKHYRYASLLNSMGDLYKVNNRKEKAISTYSEVIEALSGNPVFGENHYFVGITKTKIAEIYNSLGYFDEALDLILPSLDILVNSLGEEHYFTMSTKYTLGQIYYKLGKYDQSLTLYSDILTDAESKFGEQSEFYSKVLNSLATTYTALGDYDRAIAVHQEELELAKNILGKEHVDYAISLSNLGNTYLIMENPQKAIPYFIEARQIISKTQGKEYDHYYVSSNSLMQAHIDLKQYEEAEIIGEEIQPLILNSLGQDHFQYGHFLSTSAILNYFNTSYTKALEYSKDAERVIKQNVGQYHPLFLSEKINQLHIYQALKEDDSANLTCEIISSHILNALENQVSTIPTELQLRQILSQYEEPIDKLHSFYFDSGFPIPSIFDDLLKQLKGFVANSSINMSNEKESNEYKQWLSLKLLEGQELSKVPSNQRSDLDSLQFEIEQLELKLLSNNSFKNQRLAIKHDLLRGKLLSNEVIIDIHNYKYYRVDQETDTVNYVAHITLPDNSTVHRIPLFQEKDVLKAIDKKMHTQGELYASRGLTPKKDKRETSNLSFIWEKLLPHLDAIQKVYLSTSGVLNQINMGVIPINDKNIFLDKYDLVQYASLRSMLADNVQPVDIAPLLVGNLNYDVDLTMSPSDTLADIGTPKGAKNKIQELRSMINNKWNYLPGSTIEMKNIEKQMAKKSVSYSILEQHNGNEENIKALLNQEYSPKWLHFATHGFFYPKVEKESSSSAFLNSDNPLIRSGLILSGANYAWQNGFLAPGQEEDGILTALEISTLNLANTELVVLSACDTGLGEIQGNEGVYGLQRAFKIAGARYLLMSLWQVSDKETADFMSTFYKYWLQKNKSIPDAYAATQKKMRKKYKDPSLWAGFILVE